MRAISADSRRFAWCRGNALWIMGLPVATLHEDVGGAAAEEQRGLLRHVARALGEACAVMIALAERNERPVPPPSLRAAWALERIEGHDLWEDCWALVAADDEDESCAEVAQRCDRLLGRVREIVGEVPDPLTPGGYFPALALAREWLKLLDAVGEPGFLPKEWTRG